MTAQNLAVCFAPNLFSLSSAPLYKVSSGMVRKGSFKRNTLTPGLSPTQLASNKEVTDSVVSEDSKIASVLGIISHHACHRCQVTASVR